MRTSSFTACIRSFRSFTTTIFPPINLDNVRQTSFMPNAKAVKGMKIWKAPLVPTGCYKTMLLKRKAASKREQRKSSLLLCRAGAGSSAPSAVKGKTPVSEWVNLYYFMRQADIWRNILARRPKRLKGPKCPKDTTVRLMPDDKINPRCIDLHRLFVRFNFPFGLFALLSLFALLALFGLIAKKREPQ